MSNSEPVLTRAQSDALWLGWIPGLEYRLRGDWGAVGSVAGASGSNFQTATIYRLADLGFVVSPPGRRSAGFRLQLTEAGVAAAKAIEARRQS